jgi:hypothetical protein
MTWQIGGELLLAVLVASVMGSFHCVGMCGPFALMAVSSQTQASERWKFVGLYHFGRMVTYIFAAIIVGMAGMIVSLVGESVGIQSVAARIAGAVMVLVGISRLWSFVHRSNLTDADPKVTDNRSGLGTAIAGQLAKARPLLKNTSPPVRSFVTGALTTLLPCGWLYIFLLVASGTESIQGAIAVMFAFWIGTIPWLTMFAIGVLRLTPRLGPLLPLAGSLLLLVTGLYTATGRAASDLSLWMDLARTVEKDSKPGKSTEHLDALLRQPPPCCQEAVGNSGD